MLFNSPCQGLDAALDGGEDHEGVHDQREPVAPGAFDVGPADDNGADAEGLEEHFELAGPDGAELHAAALGDVPKRLDDDLTGEDYNRRAPADDVHRHFRKFETEHLRLVDPGKTEKCPADEELVGQRIDGAAEFAGHFELAGQVAVDDVGQPGDDEQDERAQQQVGRFRLGPGSAGMDDHPQKDHRQDQPPDCQGVGNMLYDAFVLFFRHKARL